MLKAIGTTFEGARVIYLGLTPELIRQLYDGKVVRMSGHALGVPAEIVLFGGNVEAVTDDKLCALNIVEEPDAEGASPELANSAHD